MKLLIVGFSQAGHMGSYLAAAARRLDLDCNLFDAANAQSRSYIMKNLYWRLLDKRPARLRRFGRDVIDLCIATKRNVVLTTGCAPLERSHIERLHGLGVTVFNYSTDDPWNPT